MSAAKNTSDFVIAAALVVAVLWALSKWGEGIGSSVSGGVVAVLKGLFKGVFDSFDGATDAAPSGQTGTDVIDYQAPDGGTELDQVG